MGNEELFFQTVFKSSVIVFGLLMFPPLSPFEAFDSIWKLLSVKLYTLTQLEVLKELRKENVHSSVQARDSKFCNLVSLGFFCCAFSLALASSFGVNKQMTNDPIVFRKIWDFISTRKYFKEHKLNSLSFFKFYVSLKYSIMQVNPKLHFKPFDYLYLFLIFRKGYQRAAQRWQKT